MIDFFHFWTNSADFQELEILQPSELAHVHFQDVVDTPPKFIDNDSRVIPGDGAAPLVCFIRKLSEKQYTGALSIELFRSDFVNGDPFRVANEIRKKCETIMHEAQKT